MICVVCSHLVGGHSHFHDNQVNVANLHTNWIWTLSYLETPTLTYFPLVTLKQASNDTSFALCQYFLHIPYRLDFSLIITKVEIIDNWLLPFIISEWLQLNILSRYAESALWMSECVYIEQPAKCKYLPIEFFIYVQWV